MEIKIFQQVIGNSISDLEQMVNKWLAEPNKVRIIQFVQSESEGVVTITILFEKVK